METKVFRLGDCVLCNPAVKLVKGKVYPVIDIDKITVGRKFVTNKDVVVYDGQGGAKFECGDTLMARITPCLENGKMAKAQIDGQGIGSTELFVFRGKEGISVNDFVYYLFKQQYIRDLAANSMTGASGRQRADLKFIKKIKLDLPSLDTQRRIASILSVYDNLIENNTRRIRLLEQIAENLYKEWFVRFRFPRHEKVEFENGLPKGWNYKRADDVMLFNPTLKVGNQTKFIIIPMEALNISSMVLDSNSFEIKETISGRRSQNGDTLFAKITPCLENGKIGFVMGLPEGEVYGGSTEFIVLRSKTLSPYYVYCTARSYHFRQTAILSMNGADGRQRVDEEKLKSYKVVQPSKEFLEEFDRIVSPSFKQILHLTQENRNLIEQRDLLLPRLMSGKLEVKE